MVAEKKCSLGVLIDDDEYAAVCHQCHVGTQDIDYLYGFVSLYATFYMDEQSILDEHGVEGSYGIVGTLSQLPVVCSHEVGVIFGIGLERSHFHPFGQYVLWL